MGKLFTLLFLLLATTAAVSAQSSHPDKVARKGAQAVDLELLDLRPKQRKAIDKIHAATLDRLAELRESGQLRVGSAALADLRNQELKAIEAVLNERQAVIFRQRLAASDAAIKQ